MALRIFISSTKADLEAYRDVAAVVARELHFDVEMMEDFGPDGQAPVELCRERAEACDILIGIYAHRFGFVPNGSSGQSITQLEYKWAKAAGAEILAFLVDEEHPWPPPLVDQKNSKKLKAFKALLKNDHTVDFFTTPDDFRNKLFKYLSVRRAAGDKASESVAPRRVKPPAAFIPHTYSLLQTKGLIGRARELEALEEWAILGDDPVRCVLAIGGMGKSAMSWHWFQTQVAGNVFNGKIWWSFYEADAGFEQFLTAAVAYFENKRTDIVAKLTSFERERRLLDHLSSGEHVVVLDGAERLLLAYSGLDYAHLDDDELDRVTANRLAAGAPIGDGAAARRLRKAIDPHVDSFLRKLVSVRSSKILITSRLFPLSLQDVAMKPLPGVCVEELGGLDPEDALTLWRSVGVGGDPDDLKRMFATFGNYPLLVRALAGEVANSRSAPGDFELWKQENPGFDPFALPLVQVKTHVLAYALANLNEHARKTLNAVAAYRSPVPYETLRALRDADDGAEKSALDADLTELEDRGLLGWDRVNNAYDLHPVVRNVVWNTSGESSREGVLDSITGHFESASMGGVERSRLAVKSHSAIEYYYALVRRGRFEDAVKLYRERFGDDLVSIARSDARTEIAMLEALPRDWIYAPTVSNGQEHWPNSAPDYRMPILYTGAHEFRKAIAGYRSLIERWPRSAMSPLMAATTACKVLVRMGLTRDAWVVSQAIRDNLDELKEEHEWGEQSFYVNVGVLRVLLRGEEDGGGRFTEIVDRRGRPGVDAYHKINVNEVCMLLGKPLIYPHDGSDLLRAYSDYTAGRLREAHDRLAELVVRARERGLLEIELRSDILIAKIYLALGQHQKAREALDDALDLAGVGPSELLRVDALNLMAELSIAEKNVEDAKRFAEAAHRASLGAYRQGEARSRELLSSLGVEAATSAEVPTEVSSRDAAQLLASIMKRVAPSGED